MTSDAAANGGAGAGAGGGSMLPTFISPQQLNSLKSTTLPASASSVQSLNAAHSGALTTEQKMLQLQLIQRQYAHSANQLANSTSTNTHNSTSASATQPTSLESLAQLQNSTGVDLTQITQKALQKAQSKRRPPNAHVQHYDEEPSTASSTSASFSHYLHSSQSGASLLTPRTSFDMKRKAIARLTITLIMQLNIEQIRAIRAEFDEYPLGVNMSQFVHIMTKHIYSPQLASMATPTLFIQSLIELFEAMDLDGDQSLEWEELLSTIVHMGMGATDHLVLSPINPYRPGPDYYGSKLPGDKSIRWHEGLGRVVYVETEQLVVRLEEASWMKGGGQLVKVGQGSVLCCEWVHGYGKMDEMKIGGEDSKRGDAGGAAAGKDEQHSRPKPAVSNTAGRGAATGGAAGRSVSGDKKSAKGDKDKGRSGGERDRVESRKHEAEKRKVDNYTFYKSALLFTSKDKKHNFKTFQSSQQHIQSASSSSAAATSSATSADPTANSGSTGESRTGQYITDPHSDETYFIVKERSTGSRLGNDDLLITSTSQYLSLWEGLPSGDVRLCDSKKVKCPYSIVRWCVHTQRLFTGDVNGAVHSWRIVNAVGQPQHSGKWQTGSRQQQTTCKLVKERTFTGHTDVITALVTIPSMSFLISASLDHSIRMWDIHTASDKNCFMGHRAGVVDLCYSNEYRFLLSASIDHDVCVWSPFADHVVFKLVGHTSPLVGVQFVTGTPQIVTADTEGWIKVWDARNFTCCQTFMATPNMTSFTTCGATHGRIIVVSRQPLIQVFDCEGGPYLKVTDDDPIYTALYSSLSMSFLTCNRQDIKLWNGLNGRLSRVYRGLSDAPISALCFDKRERKLFVGDKQGKIRVYNALTGAYMKSLSPHSDEILFLEYIGERRELVSASVDRQLKVHDERPIEEQVVLLDLTLARDVEILGVCVSQRAHMVAVAGSDGRIGCWNIENGLRDDINPKPLTDVMSALTFLDPHPLLAMGDEGGHVTVYYTRPSHIKGDVAFSVCIGREEEGELVGGVSVLRWQNERGEESLYVGNLHGQVRVYRLHDLLASVMADMNQHAKEQQVKRMGALGLSTSQHETPRESQASQSPSKSPQPLSARSPLILSARASSASSPSTSSLSIGHHSSHPSFTLSSFRYGGSSQSALTNQLLANLRPISSFHAHTNAISSITLTSDPPALVTTARMHQVKVWSTAGDLLGVMDSQGLMLGGNTDSETDEADEGASGGGADGVAGGGKVDWRFFVDVSVKERAELGVTQQVLSELDALQRRESEKQREEKEAEEREDEEERQKRRALKRQSHLESEKWLPMQWQQAVHDTDGANKGGPSQAEEGDVLSALLEAVDEESKEQFATPATSVPASNQSTSRTRSNSHNTPHTSSKVRFQPPVGRAQRSNTLPTLHSARDTTAMERPAATAQAEAEVVVLPAIQPAVVVEAVESEAAEKLVADAAVGHSTVVLPPLNFGTAAEPATVTTVLQSMRSARAEAAMQQKPAEEQKDAMQHSGREEHTKTDSDAGKFSYPVMHTLVAGSSTFTLGLEGRHPRVKLNDARLSAAKRLQRALQQSDD